MLRSGLRSDFPSLSSPHGRRRHLLYDREDRLLTFWLKRHGDGRVGFGDVTQTRYLRPIGILKQRWRLDFDDTPFVSIALCPDDRFYLNPVAYIPIGRKMSVAPFVSGIGVQYGIPYLLWLCRYPDRLGERLERHS
ncbi:hypothetical protein CHELA40_12563 [Chelatococcus asaccharovorans]|nr:hypothetical protein CHELA40_12563 [Chelatococcus asaccharovorans]